MRKLLNLLTSRFKEPVTYYLLGSLHLIYGGIIKPILNISYNRFSVIFGTAIVLIGICIDIGKHRVNSISDTELDKKITSIKNMYFQNIIRNLYTFYIRYRAKDMYLCKFYRKTGTVLAIFVDSIEKVNEYIDWYLEKDNITYQNINITSNRTTKIQPIDIEEFEYQRISWLQQKFVHPLLAFLKQPSYIFISFKQIFMFTLLLILIAVGYGYISKEYTFNGYTFTGVNSIETLNYIINFIKSIIIMLLPIWILLTLSIGISSMKKAFNNFYTNSIVCKKTIFRQLLAFASIPFCYNLILEPIIIELIEFARAYGYFLP